MGKVFVPYGESAQDTAVLLLAQAESQGDPADVVGTTDGGFLVDSELADAAGVDYDKESHASSSDEAARAEAAREEGEPVHDFDEEPEAEKPEEPQAEKPEADEQSQKSAKKSSR